MAKRSAFTLIEVLISIALMGIIVLALFSAVDMLQNSNQHLLSYLQKSKTVGKTTETLYLDIMDSDGNLSIQKDEFSRVCMEKTKHSLYALPEAKVCWVVLKNENTLARIEGVTYHLPLVIDENVEVDLVMPDMEVFDVYHENDKILVLMQQKGKEPISFMLQGVKKSTPKPPAPKPPLNAPQAAPPTTSATPTSPVPTTPSTPAVPAAPTAPPQV